MNKYEIDILKDNIKKLEELESSVGHLSLYHLYLHSTLLHIKTAKEELQSVLRIV